MASTTSVPVGAGGISSVEARGWSGVQDNDITVVVVGPARHVSGDATVLSARSAWPGGEAPISLPRYELSANGKVVSAATEIDPGARVVLTCCVPFHSSHPDISGTPTMKLWRDDTVLVDGATSAMHPTHSYVVTDASTVVPDRVAVFTYEVPIWTSVDFGTYTLEAHVGTTSAGQHRVLERSTVASLPDPIAFVVRYDTASAVANRLFAVGSSVVTTLRNVSLDPRPVSWAKATADPILRDTVAATVRTADGGDATTAITIDDSNRDRYRKMLGDLRETSETHQLVTVGGTTDFQVTDLEGYRWPPDQGTPVSVATHKAYDISGKLTTQTPDVPVAIRRADTGAHVGSCRSDRRGEFHFVLHTTLDPLPALTCHVGDAPAFPVVSATAGSLELDRDLHRRLERCAALYRGKAVTLVGSVVLSAGATDRVVLMHGATEVASVDVTATGPWLLPVTVPDEVDDFDLTLRLASDVGASAAITITMEATPTPADHFSATEADNLRLTPHFDDRTYRDRVSGVLTDERPIESHAIPSVSYSSDSVVRTLTRVAFHGTGVPGTVVTYATSDGHTGTVDPDTLGRWRAHVPVLQPHVFSSIREWRAGMLYPWRETFYARKLVFTFAQPYDFDMRIMINNSQAAYVSSPGGLDSSYRYTLDLGSRQLVHAVRIQYVSKPAFLQDPVAHVRTVGTEWVDVTHGGTTTRHWITPEGEFQKETTGESMYRSINFPSPVNTGCLDVRMLLSDQSHAQVVQSVPDFGGLIPPDLWLALPTDRSVVLPYERDIAVHHLNQVDTFQRYHSVGLVDVSDADGSFTVLGMSNPMERTLRARFDVEKLYNLEPRVFSHVGYFLLVDEPDDTYYMRSALLDRLVNIYVRNTVVRIYVVAGSGAPTVTGRVNDVSTTEVNLSVVSAGSTEEVLEGVRQTPDKTIAVDLYDVMCPPHMRSMVITVGTNTVSFGVETFSYQVPQRIRWDLKAVAADLAVNTCVAYECGTDRSNRRTRVYTAAETIVGVNRTLSALPQAFDPDNPLDAAAAEVSPGFVPRIETVDDYVLLTDTPSSRAWFTATTTGSRADVPRLLRGAPVSTSEESSGAVPDTTMVTVDTLSVKRESDGTLRVVFPTNLATSLFLGVGEIVRVYTRLGYSPTPLAFELRVETGATEGTLVRTTAAGRELLGSQFGGADGAATPFWDLAVPTSATDIAGGVTSFYLVRVDTLAEITTASSDDASLVRSSGGVVRAESDTYLRGVSWSPALDIHTDVTSDTTAQTWLQLYDGTVRSTERVTVARYDPDFRFDMYQNTGTLDDAGGMRPAPHGELQLWTNGYGFEEEPYPREEILPTPIYTWVSTGIYAVRGDVLAARGQAARLEIRMRNVLDVARPQLTWEVPTMTGVQISADTTVLTIPSVGPEHYGTYVARIKTRVMQPLDPKYGDSGPRTLAADDPLDTEARKLYSFRLSELTVGVDSFDQGPTTAVFSDFCLVPHAPEAAIDLTLDLNCSHAGGRVGGPVADGYQVGVRSSGCATPFWSYALTNPHMIFDEDGYVHLQEVSYGPRVLSRFEIYGDLYYGNQRDLLARPSDYVIDEENQSFRLHSDASEANTHFLERTGGGHHPTDFGGSRNRLAPWTAFASGGGRLRFTAQIQMPTDSAIDNSFEKYRYMARRKIVREIPIAGVHDRPELYGEIFAPGTTIQRNLSLGDKWLLGKNDFRTYGWDIDLTGSHILSFNLHIINFSVASASPRRVVVEIPRFPENRVPTPHLSTGDSCGFEIPATASEPKAFVQGTVVSYVPGALATGALTRDTLTVDLDADFPRTLPYTFTYDGSNSLRPNYADHNKYVTHEGPRFDLRRFPAHLAQRMLSGNIVNPLARHTLSQDFALGSHGCSNWGATLPAEAPFPRIDWSRVRTQQTVAKNVSTGVRIARFLEFTVTGFLSDRSLATVAIDLSPATVGIDLPRNTEFQVLIDGVGDTVVRNSVSFALAADTNLLLSNTDDVFNSATAASAYKLRINYDTVEPAVGDEIAGKGLQRFTTVTAVDSSADAYYEISLSKTTNAEAPALTEWRLTRRIDSQEKTAANVVAQRDAGFLCVFPDGSTHLWGGEFAVANLTTDPPAGPIVQTPTTGNFYHILGTTVVAAGDTVVQVAPGPTGTAVRFTSGKVQLHVPRHVIDVNYQFTTTQLEFTDGTGGFLATVADATNVFACPHSDNLYAVTHGASGSRQLTVVYVSNRQIQRKTFSLGSDDEAVDVRFEPVVDQSDMLMSRAGDSRLPFVHWFTVTLAAEGAVGATQLQSNVVFDGDNIRLTNKPLGRYLLGESNVFVKGEGNSTDSSIDVLQLSKPTSNTYASGATLTLGGFLIYVRTSAGKLATINVVDGSTETLIATGCADMRICYNDNQPLVVALTADAVKTRVGRAPSMTDLRTGLASAPEFVAARLSHALVRSGTSVVAAPSVSTDLRFRHQWYGVNGPHPLAWWSEIDDASNQIAVNHGATAYVEATGSTVRTSGHPFFGGKLPDALADIAVDQLWASGASFMARETGTSDHHCWGAPEFGGTAHERHYHVTMDPTTQTYDFFETKAHALANTHRVVFPTYAPGERITFHFVDRDGNTTHTTAAHPLSLQDENGVVQVESPTSIYSIIVWEVPADVPATLRTYCSIHGVMGNTNRRMYRGRTYYCDAAGTTFFPTRADAAGTGCNRRLGPVVAAGDACVIVGPDMLSGITPTATDGDQRRYDGLTADNGVVRITDVAPPIRGSLFAVETTDHAWAVIYDDDRSIGTWGHEHSGGDSADERSGNMAAGNRFAQVVSNRRAFAARTEGGVLVCWGGDDRPRMQLEMKDGDGAWQPEPHYRAPTDFMGDVNVGVDYTAADSGATRYTTRLWKHLDIVQPGIFEYRATFVPGIRGTYREPGYSQLFRIDVAGASVRGLNYEWDGIRYASQVSIYWGTDIYPGNTTITLPMFTGESGITSIADLFNDGSIYTDPLTLACHPEVISGGTDTDWNYWGSENYDMLVDTSRDLVGADGSTVDLSAATSVETLLEALHGAGTTTIPADGGSEKFKSGDAPFTFNDMYGRLMLRVTDADGFAYYTGYALQIKSAVTRTLLGSSTYIADELRYEYGGYVTFFSGEDYTSDSAVKILLEASDFDSSSSNQLTTPNPAYTTHRVPGLLELLADYVTGLVDQWVLVDGNYVKETSHLGRIFNGETQTTPGSRLGVVLSNLRALYVYTGASQDATSKVLDRRPKQVQFSQFHTMITMPPVSREHPHLSVVTSSTGISSNISLTGTTMSGSLTLPVTSAANYWYEISIAVVYRLASLTTNYAFDATKARYMVRLEHPDTDSKCSRWFRKTGDYVETKYDGSGWTTTTEATISDSQLVWTPTTPASGMISTAAIDTTMTNWTTATPATGYEALWKHVYNGFIAEHGTHVWDVPDGYYDVRPTTTSNPVSYPPGNIKLRMQFVQGVLDMTTIAVIENGGLGAGANVTLTFAASSMAGTRVGGSSAPVPLMRTSLGDLTIDMSNSGHEIMLSQVTYNQPDFHGYHLGKVVSAADFQIGGMSPTTGVKQIYVVRILDPATGREQEIYRASSHGDPLFPIAASSGGGDMGGGDMGGGH